MGVVSDSYQTIKFRNDRGLATLQFHRPEANNTINDQLVSECRAVLAEFGSQIRVLVIEGLPEVFCFGADFKAIHQAGSDPAASDGTRSAEDLYDLWLDLAQGPYVTVAHVRGKANAGGMGFVAACDIVLADETAAFSLSELLFGLFPACVLPFLIRKIGKQKAHYMTLMTVPVQVGEAHRWGLVDAYAANSDDLLRRHMLRLRRLSKSGIQRYKTYLASLENDLAAQRDKAVVGNRAVFNDPENLEKIARFVETGQFPWEGGHGGR
ncbi:enoyl-CoA hydratase/isomerase [Acanthopleuribacter pedis]|uniref:Enoyl-CoA hydratase/isomerase n=1 Tax=Acanthopleuribacter pedis TaxID=442870 RepID=A0A8J7QJE1_9BACT|nr:enoyl-CoA hydratase/isomerase [Acanthopleuribacter pedis]MBO1319298.1 enoyl-CoA hydratase/isomerase [Acanthopleuribacter pedis]